MSEDYKELVEYLDEKFIKINDEFVDLKSQVLSIENKLDNKVDKSDFNDLQTSIDAYAGKADKYFQEMLMLSHKLDRHEKWLHQVADKLGIKLEY